jgi:hypothetical protein
VRLELTSGPRPPPVFKTGPSSGRMASVGDWDQVPGAGIEPAASAFRARRHYHQQLPRIREGGFEPPPPDSKSGSLPISRFPRAPRGSRTRLSGLGSPSLTARPGTHRINSHIECGIGDSNPGGTPLGSRLVGSQESCPWTNPAACMRKERESNPQGSGHRPKGGRARVRAGCRRPSACPSPRSSSGGRNRTCVSPVNSRALVPARTPPESSR